MGNRQRLRREFFQKHPMCCFCGGSAPATEEDHIPARHLFRNRVWPEGYVFPACSTCNDESTSDELAMGFLVRIAVSEIDAEDEHEMSLALGKLNDRRPGWIKAMREMSRIEVRQEVRKRGLSLEGLSSLAGGEVYIVTMPQDLLDVPKRYGSKLAKALYYLHTGRILPVGGFVRVAALPNTSFMSPHFPVERFNILAARPSIVRGGKSLDDQFAYRYGLPVDGGGAGFLIQFRESTVIIALVYEDATAYAARIAERSFPDL